MRADAMLDKGDLDGQAVWLKAPGTVREPQDTERAPGCIEGLLGPILPRILPNFYPRSVSRPVITSARYS